MGGQFKVSSAAQLESVISSSRLPSYPFVLSGICAEKMNWRRHSISYELLKIPQLASPSPSVRIRTWSDSIAETATAEGKI